MRDATHSSHLHETSSSNGDTKGECIKTARINHTNAPPKTQVPDLFDWEQAQFLMCDHRQQPQHQQQHQQHQQLSHQADEHQSNVFQRHHVQDQEEPSPLSHNEVVMPPDLHPPPLPPPPPPPTPPLPPLSMVAHDSRTVQHETQFQYQFQSSQNQHHQNLHQGRPSRVCLPSISTSCPRTISVSSNDSDYYCDQLNSSPDDSIATEMNQMEPSPTEEWLACRDPRYWERRRKNNLAAKKSRDARRVRENQLRIKVLCLENANQALRNQVAQEKQANATLRSKIRSLESTDEDKD
ncbi:hypothetical protein TCAL_16202 [Tigriopus californicus]|uniref:BZIP domain-containing protein n=1 Tax=Tigriopus californicus TaxID=6832 RepID=A0A553P2H6_TIGCA|nr:putative mediator of RNA polymerase II transcription subunit 29 isoform X2 [Tigriopus californicus]TRY71850.1 hypothetical protein TCAL_16202 [Tigriopus californicus]